MLFTRARNGIAPLFLCVWAVAGSSVEAQTPAGSPLPVDTALSRVYIKVSSATRLGHDHGVMGQLASGEVTLGGPGDLVFDMRTFVSDLPEARVYVGLAGAVSASDAKKTTDTMLGKDVLGIAQYPTARYTFRSSKPADGQADGAPGRYQLDGDFTLRGVTRKQPLTVLVEEADRPGYLRIRGDFTIPQSQFGMKPYTAVGGLVGIKDPLRIWGDLLVAKARPAAPASPTPDKPR